ncbi:MAG: phage tail protein I [Gammaproteobacteria bacterium]|nr:phage tail protein I [Gammaproteobacteria bacterium]
MNSLLPPNASQLEQNLVDTSARIGNVPSLPPLWDPDTCPTYLLSWLAWALSVEEWDSNWPEVVQREAIKQARDIHKNKGTVGSLKRALSSLGYGDAIILEGLDAEQYNGAITFDGSHYYGQEATHWALYRVYLSRPISVQQAEHVRRILASTARGICKLEGLHYTGVLNIYNGDALHNGTTTYGEL